MDGALLLSVSWRVFTISAFSLTLTGSVILIRYWCLWVCLQSPCQVGQHQTRVHGVCKKWWTSQIRTQVQSKLMWRFTGIRNVWRPWYQPLTEPALKWTVHSVDTFPGKGTMLTRRSRPRQPAPERQVYLYSTFLNVEKKPNGHNKITRNPIQNQNNVRYKQHSISIWTVKVTGSSANNRHRSVVCWNGGKERQRHVQHTRT